MENAYWGKEKGVCAVTCPDYQEENVNKAMKECMDVLDGLKWVRPGMRIGLKINLVSGMDPGKAATIHPQIVISLSRMLIDRGASVIVGDSPGGMFTRSHIESVYRACQMVQTEAAGAKLNRNCDISEAVFEKAQSIRTFSYTAWLDQTDAIISISKFKTHAMMGMSCCVKNLFGVVPGLMKPEYHMRFPSAESFADMLVDLNEYFHPVFQIVDAVEGMEGNGPTAGTRRHVGALIAGWSPYETDIVCAHMMGLGRMDVPTLEAAFLRGLGPESFDETDVSGDKARMVLKHYELASHSLSVTFGDSSASGKVVSGFLRHILSSRPQLNASECIGCGKCSRICPAKAITMVSHRPKIDREKCIHCFCCQEFCPEGAMKVHHNSIGKMVRKLNTGFR